VELPRPTTLRVVRPPEVPVSAILPLSNLKDAGLNPVDLSANRPKLVAEFVMDR